jgi:hypothetical protein
MANIDFKIFGFILLLLGISFVIGSLISFIFKIIYSKEPFLKTFVSTLIGTIVLIIIHASIITGFETVQLLFIIVGLISFYSYRKHHYVNDNKSNQHNTPYFKIFISIFFVILVIFVCQSLLFYNEPFDNIPHGDYSFYSTIIEGYHFFNVETKQTVIDTISISYNPSMYHHTDLWLGSIFYSIGISNSIEAFTVGAFTYLFSLVALGFIALAKSFTKNKLIIFLSPLLIMFYGMPFWIAIPQMQTFIQAIGFNPKNLINGLFILPSIILMINKNRFFHLPLLALPIVNVINLPAIFGALITLGLVGLFFPKFRLENYKELIWQPLVISFFIALFYYIAPSSEIPTIKELDITTVIHSLYDNPKKPVLIIAGSILSIFLIYLVPITFLITLKKVELKSFIQKKQYYLTILFIVIVGVIGLFTWSFMYILKDSAQFFYMPFVTILNIGLIIFLIKLITYFSSTNQKKKYIVVLAGFILLTTYSYVFVKKNNPFVSFYNQTEYRSETYLRSVKQTLIKEKKPILIAYIVDTNNFENFWMAIPYHQPDRYIKSIVSGIRQVSLSTEQVPTHKYSGQEKVTLIREIENAPFSNFVSNLKKNQNFKSIRNSQHKFITENKIPYLIVDKYADYPKSLTSNIKSIIIDSLSGEKFIILKY